MSLILSWLILTVAVWITAAVLPGFHVKDFKGALIVAAVFGVLNFFLGWLLFLIFSVVTLGLAWLLGFLTRWLINTLLLMLTDRLSENLKIDSLGWAAAGALMISVVGLFLSWALPWV